MQKKYTLGLAVGAAVIGLTCAQGATSVPVMPVEGLHLLWVDATSNQNYKPGLAVNPPDQAAYFQTLAERIAAHQPFGWEWNRVIMTVESPGSNPAYQIPLPGDSVQGRVVLKTTPQQSVFFTDFMQNLKLVADKGSEIMVNPYLGSRNSAWTNFSAPACVKKVGALLAAGLKTKSGTYQLPDPLTVTSAICWANAAQTYLKGLKKPAKLISGLTFDFQGAGIKDGRAVTLIRNAMNLESNTKAMKLTATGGFKNLAWYNPGTWGTATAPGPNFGFQQLDELYIQNYNIWANNCSPAAKTCGGKTKYTYVGGRSRGASGGSAPLGFMPIQQKNGVYTGDSIYTQALQTSNPVNTLLPNDPDATENGVNMLYILYNPSGKAPGAAQYSADKFFDSTRAKGYFQRVFFMFSSECTSGANTDGCAQMVSYPGVSPTDQGAGAINAFGATYKGKSYSAQDVKDATERFETFVKGQGAFGKHAESEPMNMGIYQYQMMPAHWFTNPVKPAQ